MQTHRSMFFEVHVYVFVSFYSVRQLSPSRRCRPVLRPLRPRGTAGRPRGVAGARTVGRSLPPAANSDRTAAARCSIDIIVLRSSSCCLVTTRGDDCLKSLVLPRKWPAVVGRNNIYSLNSLVGVIVVLVVIVVVVVHVVLSVTVQVIA